MAACTDLVAPSEISFTRTYRLRGCGVTDPTHSSESQVSCVAFFVSPRTQEFIDSVRLDFHDPHLVDVMVAYRTEFVCGVDIGIPCFPQTIKRLKVGTNRTYTATEGVLSLEFPANLVDDLWDTVRLTGPIPRRVSRDWQGPDSLVYLRISDVQVEKTVILKPQ